jgi:hypothetical protein
MFGGSVPGLASDDVAEKLHVDLSGAPQTMLATLYAKALDADFDKPRLGDRWAKEIVERLDYDWTKTSISVRSAPSVTTRSAHYDNWARQFLAMHPRAVVLHLGCGLDSRFFRHLHRRQLALPGDGEGHVPAPGHALHGSVPPLRVLTPSTGCRRRP